MTIGPTGSIMIRTQLMSHLILFIMPHIMEALTQTPGIKQRPGQTDI